MRHAASGILALLVAACSTLSGVEYVPPDYKVERYLVTYEPPAGYTRAGHLVVDKGKLAYLESPGGSSQAALVRRHWNEGGTDFFGAWGSRGALIWAIPADRTKAAKIFEYTSAEFRIVQGADGEERPQPLLEKSPLAVVMPLKQHETPSAQAARAPGTTFIAEVSHLLTRNEILSGETAKAIDSGGRKYGNPELANLLKKRGFADGDLQDGRFALLRFQYYWHNARAVVHENALIASVPAGLQLAVGNVVDAVALNGEPAVLRVRYADLATGQCAYQISERSSVLGAVASLSIGPPGARSLYCPMLQTEGWVRHDHGYGFTWQKSDR